MIKNRRIQNPANFAELNQIVYSLDNSIEKVISKVPQKDKSLTRFVVTEHSQGEGLAQICLPYVITKFVKMTPGFVDDTKTPRFFGYFLSDPRVFVDQQTNIEHSNYINKFNMISHCAFRNIVPTAALLNFSPLGCMAYDSVYDVLYCVVTSKVASNYRVLLLTILRRKIDQSLLYTDQDDYWRLISNPSLSICWNEVKIIIIKKGLDEKVSTWKGLFSLINDRFTFYRNRSQIRSEELFDPKTEILSDPND